MNSFFECTFRYEKVFEDGLQKKVNEKYLVDALSFTEAEARIIEEMGSCVNGEFEVKAIKRTKISEIFRNQTSKYDLRWFTARLGFILLDEKSGKEKTTRATIMVEAENIDDAHENIMIGMKGTMADFKIESITESPILDVFLFESDK